MTHGPQRQPSSLAKIKAEHSQTISQLPTPVESTLGELIDNILDAEIKNFLEHDSPPIKNRNVR
jgi:hypothetical protein